MDQEDMDHLRDVGGKVVFHIAVEFGAIEDAKGVR